VTDLPPIEAVSSELADDAPHTEPSTPSEVVTVVADRLVAGGEALARHPDGRVVLVAGALPGEQVEVEVAPRRGALRGHVRRLVWSSPDRVRPRCPHVADGCGGCDLQTMENGAQVRAKVELVADALRRLGGVAEPVVRPGPPLTPWGFRTSLRVAVTGGRAGLRRAQSHDVVPVDHCLVAHPLVDEMVAEGRFGDAEEAVLRAGAATGERLAVVHPTAAGVRLPDDVLVVGTDELRGGRRAWIHDEVAGRRWRISAESFFQSRPDGAAALVEVVRSLVADELAVGGGRGRPRTLLDAYAGVGLFAGSLLGAAPGWRGVAAERSRSSVADARRNLADLDVKVVATTVEHLRAPRADVVVADPSRTGLGRRGVHVLASTAAPRLVLVSCDPASAGRDAALLAAVGYRAVESVLVDLFPHTHHTEVVTRFDRS
jgi:23S rRNA (uracil1939-C5)-methyltransferase